MIRLVRWIILISFVSLLTIPFVLSRLKFVCGLFGRKSRRVSRSARLFNAIVGLPWTVGRLRFRLSGVTVR